MFNTHQQDTNTGWLKTSWMAWIATVSVAKINHAGQFFYNIFSKIYIA